MAHLFSIISETLFTFAFYFNKGLGDAGLSNVGAHERTTLISGFIKMGISIVASPQVLSGLQVRGRGSLASKLFCIWRRHQGTACNNSSEHWNATGVWKMRDF